ncbi:MAG TPA: hypothetical protein DCE41_19900 [Cytophagales bacterium]|nr:hypothetical protein [Cytophagales bacterium]
MLGSTHMSKAQGLVASEQLPAWELQSYSTTQGGDYVLTLIRNADPFYFTMAQLETSDGQVLDTKSLYESAGGSIQLIMSPGTTKSREHVLRLIMHSENESAATEDLIMLLMM